MGNHVIRQGQHASVRPASRQEDHSRSGMSHEALSNSSVERASAVHASRTGLSRLLRLFLAACWGLRQQSHWAAMTQPCLQQGSCPWLRHSQARPSWRKCQSDSERTRLYVCSVLEGNPTWRWQHQQPLRPKLDGIPRLPVQVCRCAAGLRDARLHARSPLLRSTAQDVVQHKTTACGSLKQVGCLLRGAHFPRAQAVVSLCAVGPGEESCLCAAFSVRHPAADADASVNMQSSRRPACLASGGNRIVGSMRHETTRKPSSPRCR